MWTCSCQTKNKLKDRICTECRKPIPEDERKRIYNAELNQARKVAHFNYSGSSVLKKLDEYAETDDKSFFQIMHIILLSLRGFFDMFTKNYKKIIPFVLVAAVVSCIFTFTNYRNRIIYREMREVSAQRRNFVSQNIEYKFGMMAENVSQYFRLQKITVDGNEVSKLNFVGQRISLAKETVSEFLAPFTGKAGGLVEDFLDDIKEIVGVN